MAVVNSATITAVTPAGSAGAVTVTVTNLGGQSGILANGFTYVAAGAGISYVQGNYATPQSPQTTVTVTYTAAQAAGDLNVVVVGWDDAVSTVNAVTDAMGNVYTVAVGPTVVAGVESQSIYYAWNIAAAAAGANSVTVTFSSAAAYPDIRILEYSGADPNNPVDVTAAGSGNSATSSSGTVSTTNATDLLFGANLVQTTTTGPGSGYTSRLLTAPDGDIAEDEMVTATGSYSAAAPLNPSGAWIMQMVAFRAASGGATPPPTVSGVSPNGGSAAGGTAVTIAGTNFAAGATVTVGGTAATNVAVVNSTTITAVTPAGSAGAVTVTVTVGGQSGSLPGGFTYAATPTVSSVSPNSGGTAGGTAVTITGTNFAAGATVTFGGTPAASVAVVNSTTITAVTPAGSAGVATVTVTVGGQSGSLPGGFTYAATPTVSGVSPNSGSAAGGTAVTITGTNFAAGATVTFGATAATNVAVVNSATITAATPTGSAGGVTVTVTNPGAPSGILANGFTYVAAGVNTGISYVQGNYATPQSPQTTVTVTYTAAQLAGDLNVVVVGWDDAIATVNAVTDAIGNVYTLAVGPTVVTGVESQSIYYAMNIAAAAAGANSVTVTLSSAAAYPDIRILEYSGADPNNPVDVTAAGSGNSATSSSGAVATTNPTDLLFGANYVQTMTTGPGGGYISRLLTVPDGDIAEDEMVTATGSYSATATLNSSGAWIMQMVAFRTPLGTVLLTAPSNLTAGAASVSQINLSWPASISSVGLADYIVQRCQGAGCTNFVQIAALAGTSYSDTGLLPGASYSYQVLAVDTAGNMSTFSNIATATTQTPQPPTAPGNLTATPAGASQIQSELDGLHQ